MDSGTNSISIQRLCVDLAVHFLKRGQGLGQALSGKDEDFNLCNIQPGIMDGSVLDLLSIINISETTRLMRI